MPILVLSKKIPRVGGLAINKLNGCGDFVIAHLDGGEFIGHFALKKQSASIHFGVIWPWDFTIAIRRDTVKRELGLVLAW